MRYLESDTYLGVARQLKNKRVEREGRVAHIADQVRALLRGFGVDALVFGRAKHIYSIWRKMNKKGIPIEDVHDALAVRVVVDSLADCYAVLGVIHNKWQHIPPEFDDYIASPKENGYRSIHTAVVLPGEGTLEIQIRTQAMHEDAELGVCAHWSYKENFQPQQVSDQFDTKVEWLRQVIEWHEELDGSERLSTLLQHRVSEERIYVSTPAGHVLDLPVRATALDFAFRVHSDVGFSCQGVVVDGQPAHLWEELKTGQRVEVTTQTPAQPSLEWADRALGFAVTDRARAKLVHHFRTLPVAEQARLGEVSLVSRLTALVGRGHRDRILSAQQDRTEVFVEAGSLRLDGSDILEKWLQADAQTRSWVPGLFSIEVVASNRDGLLLNLTQVLGDLKLQLTGTTGRVSPDAKQAIITLETSIESWRSALLLLSRVQNLADVNQVAFSTLSPAS